LKAAQLQRLNLLGEINKFMKKYAFFLLFGFSLTCSCHKDNSCREFLSHSNYKDFNIKFDTIRILGKLTYYDNELIGYDFLNNVFVKVNALKQSLDTLIAVPKSLLPSPKVIPNPGFKNHPDVISNPILEPDQILISSPNELIICVRNKIFRFNRDGIITFFDFNDYLGDSLLLYPKKFPLLLLNGKIYCGYIKKIDTTLRWNKSDSILDRPIFLIIDTTRHQKAEFGGFMNPTYKLRVKNFTDTWCSATFYGDTLVYSFNQDSRCYFIPPDHNPYTESIDSYCFSDDDLARKYLDGESKRSNQFDIYKTFTYDKIIYDSFQKRIVRVATLPVVEEILNPYIVKKPWTIIFYYPDDRTIHEWKFDPEKYAYGDIVPTPEGIIIANIYRDSLFNDFYTILQVK